MLQGFVHLRRVAAVVCAVGCGILLFVRTSAAQPDSSQMSGPLSTAFDIHAGAGIYSDRPMKTGLRLSYEVPIGSMILSPALEVMSGGNDTAPKSAALNYFDEFNTCYGLDLWVRAPLLRRTAPGANESFFSFGFQFLVWGDRASAGVPLSYSYDIGLSRSSELDLSVVATPMVFLGRSALVNLTILAGFRFPSNDAY